MRATELFEQDEFLKEPALFKYGTLALVTAGIALCAILGAAYSWRVDSGRMAVYEATFESLSAKTVAANENISQILGRLEQSTASLELVKTTPDAENRFQSAFVAGLGLRALAVEALALSPQGDVIASTGIRTTSGEFATKVVQAALERRTVQGGQFFMPETRSSVNGSLVVPFVQRRSLPGGAEFVVYLVGSDTLRHVVHEALGTRQGELLIEDSDGVDLLQTSNVSGALAPSQLPDLTTTAQAMGQPLNFSSTRLLATSYVAAAEGLRLTYGIRESDALIEFDGRVRATWQIALFIVGFYSVVAASMAFALGRVARKETFLRRLATIDSLTGLPNRRSFHELLQKAMTVNKQKQALMGLIFIDLDNFKDVNDAMGHSVGDSLLQHAAAALKESVRAIDRVCRLGGDEFTVLLSGVASKEEAQAVGARIVEALRKPFTLNGMTLHTNASLGIALMPDHATTEADLMRFADTAMYRAKQEGKGCCVVYDHSMEATAMARAQTARELEAGIPRNELVLTYQPKFCLKSGLLSGHEALVRWKHPQRGQVFPDEFISIAEEYALISDLGNWVLERAIVQIRDWHAAGQGWQKVAINVSALQLRGDDFVLRATRLLAENNVAGALLQFELTESSLAIDAAKAREIVQRLRSLGASVAVDDFGTGFSSLGALQSFEIDCLKVDRSFINNILTPQGNAICRAVVSLGHALDMRVVAEGIETAEQRDALIRLDCDEVQGYLFARPVPPEAAVLFADGPHPAISGQISNHSPSEPLSRTC